jgi:uncharacterized membrane protein YgcG
MIITIIMRTHTCARGTPNDVSQTCHTRIPFFSTTTFGELTSLVGELTTPVNFVYFVTFPLAERESSTRERSSGMAQLGPGRCRGGGGVGGGGGSGGRSDTTYWAPYHSSVVARWRHSSSVGFRV